MVFKREVTFEVIGNPRGKERPRMTRKGIVYTPKKTKDYEELIKEGYKGTNEGKLSGEIEADIKAMYPIPKSTPKYKLQDMLKEHPQKKPDLDNIIKAVLDALNGIAYDDDKQVTKIHIEKFYSLEGKVIIKIKER